MCLRLKKDTQQQTNLQTRNMYHLWGSTVPALAQWCSVEMPPVEQTLPQIYSMSTFRAFLTLKAFTHFRSGEIPSTMWVYFPTTLADTCKYTYYYKCLKFLLNIAVRILNK